MAKEYPYFKFWAKDWATNEDIKIMPYEAKGLYIDMLAHCWIKGSMPTDPAKLRRLFGLTPAKFSKLFQHFSDSFSIENERFYNKRLEEERGKINAKSAILSQNGKKGAAIAKAKAEQLLSKSTSITESDTESESDSNKTITKNDPRIEQVFDFYYSTFSKSSSYKLTQPRKNLIAKKLKDYADAELRKAIFNMSQDDWEDRHKHSDLNNAIGTVRGIDQVSKWLEFKPTKKLTGFQKAGVPRSEDIDLSDCPDYV